MPKFIFSYLLLLLFLTTSCEKEMSFEMQNYEKSLDNCEQNCPSIAIQVPIYKNGDAFSDTINAKIFKTVKQIVSFQEKQYDVKTYEELNHAFIDSYKKLQQDFPEERFGWEGKIEGKVGYNSAQILNIVIESYMFTGGAHGYSGTNSLLFDMTTGRSIATHDIFKDKDKFANFAEKKFREKFDLPKTQNINANGLMFEGDKFSLPQMVIFKNDGIVLYYNTYEIAAYVEGPKELFIPFTEADAFLKIK